MNIKNKKLRLLLRVLIAGALLCLLLMLIADKSISRNAQGKLYSSVAAIPHNKVALVLGTSKLLQSGKLNLYFKYRVNACVALYNAQKVDYILVSGDNSRADYDEPNDFKTELIAQGIPADKIYLDFAGFRTLDSVVRAKRIFGLQQYTIISQQFHNERALYLAKQNDIDAIAFNAEDVAINQGIKVKIREYFARVKAYLDVLLGVEPKFSGETVQIG